MGQVIQVNGDYNIKAAEGARITLDTGPGVGEVKVTGNLLVTGQTLTVQSQNLNDKDNLIIVNFGETNAGVSLRYAGIQVDRGTSEPASILYDESIDTWLFVHGGSLNDPSSGSLNYVDSKIKISRIVTDSDSGGNLTVNFDGIGVLKVTDPSLSLPDIYDYTSQVIEPNDIPNKQYVDSAIQNNPTFQIVSNAAGGMSSSSRVIVSDKDTSGSLDYLSDTTGYSTYGESAVSVIVDGSLVGQFYSNRLEVGNLEVGGGLARNEITPKAGITNENIIIRTQGTGKLQTNYALQLERIGTSGETPPIGRPYIPLTPAYVNGSTLIYAASPSIGTTGLWFVNDSQEAAKRTGELISKNKALVFSMLF